MDEWPPRIARNKEAARLWARHYVRQGDFDRAVDFFRQAGMDDMAEKYEDMKNRIR